MLAAMEGGSVSWETSETRPMAGEASLTTTEVSDLLLELSQSTSDGVLRVLSEEQDSGTKVESSFEDD